MRVAIIVLFLFSSLAGYSQFRRVKHLAHLLTNYFSGDNQRHQPSGKSPFFPTTLHSGKEVDHTLKVPVPYTPGVGNHYPGDIHWMNSITTQSYNDGKMGAYYYWDVQGNLLESRLFVDIAGRNKRGLKLVFLRR